MFPLTTQEDEKLDKDIILSTSRWVNKWKWSCKKNSQGGTSSQLTLLTFIFAPMPRCTTHSASSKEHRPRVSIPRFSGPDSLTSLTVQVTLTLRKRKVLKQMPNVSPSYSNWTDTFRHITSLLWYLFMDLSKKHAFLCRSLRLWKYALNNT